MDSKQLAVLLNQIIKRLGKAIQEANDLMPEDAEKVQGFKYTGDYLVPVLDPDPKNRVLEDTEDCLALEPLRELHVSLIADIKVLLPGDEK